MRFSELLEQEAGVVDRMQGIERAAGSRKKRKKNALENQKERVNQEIERLRTKKERDETRIARLADRRSDIVSRMESENLINRISLIEDNKEDPIILGKNTWIFAEVQTPTEELLAYQIRPNLDTISEEFEVISSLNKVTNFILEAIKELTPAQKKEALGKFEKRMALKPGKPEPTEAEKGAMDALKALTKKSKMVFHSLDKLGQRNFIAKYLLHGMDFGILEKPWGRSDRTFKEIYSDHLKSLDSKKAFVNRVLQLHNKWLEDNKKAEQEYTKVTKKFKSLDNLRFELNNSNDGLTKDLISYLDVVFGKGYVPDEAMAEMCFKIQAKQYRSLTELKGCIKQYSAIGHNSKTVGSVDISTVCPKRKELLHNYAEWATKANALQKATEGGGSPAMIEKLTRDAKAYEVIPGVKNDPTCIYCYVESARLIAAKNPKYFLAKAEKESQKYQGTIPRWSPAKIETFNRMGGLRFFGSGDYVEDATTDREIKKIIVDAEKVGLQLKVVTKQAGFVRKYGSLKYESGPLKGKAVFNINVSVDEQKGFPLVDAIRLKKQNKNVKIRVVAMNPKQAAEYSKIKDIDVITLLHFTSRVKMKNKELYVSMTPLANMGKKGWKQALDLMTREIPKSDIPKILSKLCCGTAHCTSCPNACGFNPSRVEDFVSLASGKKKPLKGSKGAISKEMIDLVQGKRPDW